MSTLALGVKILRSVSETKQRIQSSAKSFKNDLSCTNLKSKSDQFLIETLGKDRREANLKQEKDIERSDNLCLPNDKIYISNKLSKLILFLYSINVNQFLLRWYLKLCSKFVYVSKCKRKSLYVKRAPPKLFESVQHTRSKCKEDEIEVNRHNEMFFILMKDVKPVTVSSSKNIICDKNLFNLYHKFQRVFLYIHLMPLTLCRSFSKPNTVLNCSVCAQNTSSSMSKIFPFFSSHHSMVDSCIRCMKSVSDVGVKSNKLNTKQDSLKGFCTAGRRKSLPDFSVANRLNMEIYKKYNIHDVKFSHTDSILDLGTIPSLLLDQTKRIISESLLKRKDSLSVTKKESCNSECNEVNCSTDGICSNLSTVSTNNGVTAVNHGDDSWQENPDNSIHLLASNICNDFPDSALHYLKLYSAIIQIHNILKKRCFNSTNRYYGTINNSHQMLDYIPDERSQSINNNCYDMSLSPCTTLGDTILKEELYPDRKNEIGDKQLGDNAKDIKGLHKNHKLEFCEPNYSTKSIVADNITVSSSDDIYMPLVKSVIFARQILQEIKDIPFIRRKLTNKANSNQVGSTLSGIKQISNYKSKFPVSLVQKQNTKSDPGKKSTFKSPNVHVLEKNSKSDFTKKNTLNTMGNYITVPNSKRDLTKKSTSNAQDNYISVQKSLSKLTKMSTSNTLHNNYISMQNTKSELIKTSISNTLNNYVSVRNKDGSISKDGAVKKFIKPNENTNYQSFKNRLETSKKKSTIKSNSVIPTNDVPSQMIQLSYSRGCNEIKTKPAAENDNKNKIKEQVFLPPNDQLYSHFIKTLNMNTAQDESNLTIDYTLSLTPKDPSTTKSTRKQEKRSNNWQNVCHDDTEKNSSFRTTLISENSDVSFKSNKNPLEQEAQFINYFKGRFENKV